MGTLRGGNPLSKKHSLQNYDTTRGRAGIVRLTFYLSELRRINATCVADRADISGMTALALEISRSALTSERGSRAELQQKLDQATRLLKAAGAPTTKDRLREMVRELERLVEIAAEREGDR